jgi:hypothetical protein
MQIIYKDRKALPSQLPPQFHDLPNNPYWLINPPYQLIDNKCQMV